MAVRCTGAQVPQAILLTGVRWYRAYPWRDRPGAALMEERGVKAAAIRSSPKAPGTALVIRQGK
jgi:hypothetical protein